MPALYSSVEPEGKIPWKAAAGLHQALGFSWFWGDFGGCSRSGLCIEQSGGAPGGCFAA